MFRETDIVDCLVPVVGWRQNSNPDYPELPPSLLISESGRVFQDEHPLIDIENIDQALKNYDLFVYPDWDPGKIYFKTQKVKGSNDKVYESMSEDNEDNDPISSPESEWLEVSPFAQKLQYITRSACSKVVNSIFQLNKLNQQSKTLMENVLLFEGAGSLTNKEIKYNRFVGVEIRIMENRDISTVIRRLGTQFSLANPDFKLYVFHSSQEKPIAVIPAALVKANSFEWTKILFESKDLVLPYNSNVYSPGGSFYVGYYEEYIVGQAINKEYDFYSGPSCTSCGNNYRYYSQWSKFIEVAPFFVAEADLDGIQPSDTEGNPTLWDISKNQYNYQINYGLNLDLTVYCDATNFLCRERSVFAEAISKQVSVDVLNYIAYSTRNNVISKETRDLADYELNNKVNGTPGAQKKLDNAIKAISFDLSDLNEICFPCGPKYGISHSKI